MFIQEQVKKRAGVLGDAPAKRPIRVNLTLPCRLPFKTVAYKLMVNLFKQVILTPFKGFTGFLCSIGWYVVSTRIEPDAETMMRSRFGKCRGRWRVNRQT
jgi:hypothetical protein